MRPHYRCGVGHHAGGHLHEGAADIEGIGHGQAVVGRLAGQEFGHQALAAPGDLRDHLGKPLRIGRIGARSIVHESILYDRARQLDALPKPAGEFGCQYWPALLYFQHGSSNVQLGGCDGMVPESAKEVSAVMATFSSVWRPPTRPRGFRLVFGFVLPVTALVGCAQVPDAINPVAWYKSTVDFFSGDDGGREFGPEAAEEQSRLVAERDQPPPGADKPFPSLTSVPARPPPRSAAERQKVVEGLIADRAGARYSSEIIRLQGEPKQTLRSGGSVAALPAPPAAPPVPRVPVTREPAQVAAPAPAAPPAPSARPAATPAPPPGANVEEVYRAPLTPRRPSGKTPALAPANAAFPGAEPPIETVDVSSAGVQVGSGASAAPPATRASASARPRGGAMAPEDPTPAPTGDSIKVATIHFVDGSARLSQGDRNILRAVYRLHRQWGGRVRVVGHASSRTRTMDPIRQKMVNLKISADRAEAVVGALALVGLRDDISVSARSDSEPLYYEVMPTGEAGNRRAEVFIDY